MHVISHGDDDLVHVDLAERASLPQPGFQVLANPTIGFPVLTQQLVFSPNGGSIPLDVASDCRIFYEEPPTGFHQSGDAF